MKRFRPGVGATKRARRRGPRAQVTADAELRSGAFVASPRPMRRRAMAPPLAGSPPEEGYGLTGRLLWWLFARIRMSIAVRANEMPITVPVWLLCSSSAAAADGTATRSEVAATAASIFERILLLPER